MDEIERILDAMSDQNYVFARISQQPFMAAKWQVEIVQHFLKDGRRSLADIGFDRFETLDEATAFIKTHNVHYIRDHNDTLFTGEWELVPEGRM